MPLSEHGQKWAKDRARRERQARNNGADIGDDRHPDDPGPNEPDDTQQTGQQTKFTPLPRTGKVTWANSIPIEAVEWAWIGDPGIDSRRFPEDAEDAKGGPLEPSESSEASTGRIPIGSLSLASGSEGVGKSCFAMWLAARVSTGTLPGAWYGKPRRVLYATVEDSWKYTIGPRLHAAGAALHRVGRFDVVSVSDERLTITLPLDNETLRQTIVDNDVALVILDPLLSMMSETLDAHAERPVRQALDPLARIADETGCVILGIAHWTKGGTDAILRITGSGAFKHVPRSVFAFARNPDDETEFVMSQVKNNLGRYDLPSIRYRIESAPVELDNGTTTYVGRFSPDGHADRSVNDILGAHSDDDTGPDQRTPAQRFIVKYIEDNGDQDYEVLAADVIEAGEPAGYRKADLTKARFKMKAIVGTRKDGMKGGWCWYLVNQPQPESEE